MIQEIINGIIAAIKTEYDESFRKYTESVKQGLVEPCFSILCLNGADQQMVSTRRSRVYPCIIKYFPETNEPIAECLAVQETLYDLLSIIDAGSSKLRGADMSGDIVDGVLQFQVTYSPFLLTAKAEINMEELEVKTDGNE